MNDQSNSKSRSVFFFGIALALGIYIGGKLSSSSELSSENKMEEIITSANRCGIYLIASFHMLRVVGRENCKEKRRKQDVSYML